MKQIILASAFAAAAVFSSVVPSQAASVVITTNHGRPMHRDMRPHHRCFTKTEKVRVHGHTVVKQTKVCR